MGKGRRRGGNMELTVLPRNSHFHAVSIVHIFSATILVSWDFFFMHIGTALLVVTLSMY